ncbi:F178B protein, partial [Alopecoenas beccarii]|nr:F178B protein [Alopecoenas beccarii]
LLRVGPAMAPHPEGLRWYQIPLSSARIPRSGIFSFGFQDSLQRYQQLRAHKNLRVGRPVAGPPPGLLEPWPPGPSPAHSPPRGSHRPRGAGGVRGERGPALGVGMRGVVTLLVATRCPQGTLGTPRLAPGPFCVPQWGPWAPTRYSEDDEELIPLRDMLLAGDTSPSPLSHQQVNDTSSPESLDEDSELPEEHRYCHRDWGSGVPTVSPPHLMPPSHPHRDILARFAVEPWFIPTVHPGEPVFCAHPALLPTLDTSGLEPRNNLEALFFCELPTWQMAFVRDGWLSLLYRCLPPCPLPVLRWLFQLMTLCPDNTNAAQALWDIWLSTGGERGGWLPQRGDVPKPLPVVTVPLPAGERWCPTVQEIGEAFARLGADLSPLLPPELRPMDGRNLEPSCSPRPASPDATNTLALVTQLSDICKFLTLCVVTQPCHYPDSARLSLVTLLSFLGLDRALRCQPLPELQFLLHCLLQGIHHWHQQGASPAPEPSRHGPAAGGAAGHRATPRGACR